MYFMFIASFLVFSNAIPIPERCCPENQYRLTGDVKPSLYSIKIHPDVAKETFTGEVFIHVKVQFAVDSIELHSSDLNVTSVQFNSRKVEFIPDVGYCSLSWSDLGYEFVHNELIRIKYGNQHFIPPGSHVIHIKYWGAFSKTREGLFKTGCTKNGKTLGSLVATDFEPTFARRVFPCFDEPAFKANFQLSVVVPNDTYTALSNMRTTSKFSTSQGVIYKFETTPPMSTYLLSFVISEYSYNEYIGEGIPFRVYSCNGSNENNSRFLEFSSKIIKFYSDYTDFNYTLPKIDFVEFDRFGSLATENWGLVTVNTSLLSSDGEYDDSQKLTVIAHELAHYWFGNLVTNQWWDDIWLQEGFATFMAVKAEEHILENDATKWFATNYMENVLWLEQSNESNPVIDYQEVPNKIRDNFNDITYNKAGAILRMLEMVMGEEHLRNAVIKYIWRYAFKTASTRDFLEILDCSNSNVCQFMESFLYQPKYPVIYVEANESYYVLTQKSCCLQRRNNFDYKWTIPISYVTNVNGSPETVWLDKDMDNLLLPKNGTTWIKFNYYQIGYYRVSYSTELWATLVEHNQELIASERDSLLLEAVALFEMDLISCDMPLKYFLELASKTSEETPFNTESAFSAFIKLGAKIKQFDSEAYKYLKEFVGHCLEKAEGKYPKWVESDYPVANDDHKSDKVKACTEWLKHNSTEYLNAHQLMFS